MPVRLYETLFLLDSNKVASEPDASKAAVHGVLEKHGCEILVSRPWDDNRKLIYPIKKHKKGYYHIIYYRTESTNQDGIEADYRIVDIVLRHLTSAIDPKWEDTMLDVARNDQSEAFAYRGMQDDTAPTDITPNLGPMDGEDGPPARKPVSEKPQE